MGGGEGARGENRWREGGGEKMLPVEGGDKGVEGNREIRRELGREGA